MGVCTAPLDTGHATKQSFSNQGVVDVCENTNIHKNKCNKDKGKPLPFWSFCRPDSLKPLPPKLQTALRRIDKLFNDAQNPKRLPFLNRFRLANPSGKSKKPVRLQHVKIVLECLISNLDLNSMRCGKPDANKFKNRSIAEIEKFTGLKYCTIQRCLRDLKKAGYLIIERIQQKTLNSFISLASIRSFTPLFFSTLGLTIKPKAKAAPASSDTPLTAIPRTEPNRWKKGIKSIKKILGVLDTC